MAEPTDTPVNPSYPPAPIMERIKALIGDLARPLAILMGAYGAMRATIIIAHKVTGFSEAALYIAAVWAGVGVLYGAKSWEVAQGGKHTANVEIAKVTTPSAPRGDTDAPVS